MQRLRRVLGAVFTSTAGLLLASACAFVPRPVETPIPMRVHGALANTEEAFVLLPGMHDSMNSFEVRGFVAVSNEALDGPNAAALVAVDAHFGYYQERSVERRLKDEVFGQLAGKRVTAVGISLGGFGALVTARRYPDLFDRIVLIAPFLGWPDNIEQIQRGAGTAPRDDLEAEVFAVWRWLADGADGIPVTLLYGRDDRFRRAYDVLATNAPRIAFRAADGAHDWGTWNALWADWLADEAAANTLAEAETPSR